MYIRWLYGIFGREITKYTVIYGVFIRFWPTLVVRSIADRWQNSLHIELQVLMQIHSRTVRTKGCKKYCISMAEQSAQRAASTNADS